MTVLEENPGDATVALAERALFNDAFLGMLVAVAARHYEKKSGGEPMPWPLAFIVVPLVVHSYFREQLPGTTAARFSTWIADRPILHASFPDRAVALTPFVKRGLRYGLRGRILQLEDGAIRSRIPLGRYESLASSEAKDAAHQAAFLGRWFAVTRDVSAIYRQFGLTV